MRLAAVGVVLSLLTACSADDGATLEEERDAAAGAAERAWEAEGTGGRPRAVEVRILDDCAAVQVDVADTDSPRVEPWIVVLSRQDAEWVAIDVRDDTLSDLDPDAENCGF